MQKTSQILIVVNVETLWRCLIKLFDQSLTADCRSAAQSSVHHWGSGTLSIWAGLASILWTQNKSPPSILTSWRVVPVGRSAQLPGFPPCDANVMSPFPAEPHVYHASYSESQSIELLLNKSRNRQHRQGRYRHLSAQRGFESEATRKPGWLIASFIEMCHSDWDSVLVLMHHASVKGQLVQKNKAQTVKRLRTGSKRLVVPDYTAP